MIQEKPNINLDIHSIKESNVMDERTRLLSSSISESSNRKKPLFISRMGSLSFYGYYDGWLKDGEQVASGDPPTDPSLEKTTDYECCCISISVPDDPSSKTCNKSQGVSTLLIVTSLTFLIVSGLVLIPDSWLRTKIPYKPVGPYTLVEKHVGRQFLDYYNFYDGPDSLGSAGYNIYVSKHAATKQFNIFRYITQQELPIPRRKDTNSPSDSSINRLNGVKTQNEDDSNEQTLIYMSSAPRYAEQLVHRDHRDHESINKSITLSSLPRASIRLEGKRRFNRGLFVLDVHHIPVGCGVWPAFWLTDEDNWPNHGEIDIVEGINYQSVAKTALHTRDQCSMYAHVPVHAKTGTWDWAYGIPNTFTGTPDNRTQKEADNCWEFAAHQWYNQGCVTVSSEEGTLGSSFNENGGGVYVLEWDPESRYIKSWVFSRANIPQNLLDVIHSHSSPDNGTIIDELDPDLWGVLPYAYFAIGEATGCSADHFVNLRIVFNLAFCGNVAGNRYFGDCPDQSKVFRVKHNDPIASCVEWIKSNPDELSEAYWAIRGVYVFERNMKWVSKTTKQK